MPGAQYDLTFQVRGDKPWSGWQPGMGEREIDPFGTVGSRFWFKDDPDRERIKRYIENERMLDVTLHHKLFSQISTETAPPEGQWLPLDLPGTLARLLRHYAVGPQFSVDAKVSGADPHVQRIFQDGHLIDKLRQVAEAFSIFGDAVLRIDVEETEDEETAEWVPLAVAKFVHPGYYHPTFNMVDNTKVERVTLAYVFPIEKDRQRDHNFPFMVLKEHHVIGEVEYELIEWDGKKEGQPIPLQAFFPDLPVGPQSTGIDEIPIIHMAFNAPGGSSWGRSEFKRIERIMVAIENRLTQQDEILDRHARPKLIVGPGVLDPTGRANLSDFDVIEVDPSVLERAIKPEYLTWDPHNSAIQAELDRLLEFFFMTTETSPSSFGIEKSGSQVESARALRFKAHRTVNKIMDLRDVMSHGIRKFFRIAMKLENAARVEDACEPYDRCGIDINWPDPIIEDRSQWATDFAAMRQGGIVSRNRAVRTLFELTPEEAQKEVDAIMLDELTSAWLPPRVTEDPRTAAVTDPMPGGANAVDPTLIKPPKPGSGNPSSAGDRPSPKP